MRTKLRNTKNEDENRENTSSESLESLLNKIKSDPIVGQRVPFIHFTPTVTEKEILYGKWVDNFLSRVPVFKYFDRLIHKGFIVPLRLKKHFDDLEYHGKEEAELIGLKGAEWKSTGEGMEQLILNGTQ